MVNGKINRRKLGSVANVNRALAQADKNRRARMKKRGKAPSVKRRQSAIRSGTRNINNVLDPKGFV